MDVVTGLGLLKTVSELGKKITDLARNVKDHDTKQQLSEILDTLISLKQSASELEDQNRDLRETLRFKGDDFEFKNPFWYAKKHPDRPLCAKCFGKEQASPMGEPYRANGLYRRCLVCGNVIELEREDWAYAASGPGGPHGWMAR